MYGFYYVIPGRSAYQTDMSCDTAIQAIKGFTIKAMTRYFYLFIPVIIYLRRQSVVVYLNYACVCKINRLIILFDVSIKASLYLFV